MMTHVVMWKFKEGAPLEALADALMGLKGKVPVIKDISAGMDFLKSPRSWDMALVVTFNQKKDLQIYQDHPEHLKVAQLIGEWKTEGASVDFEA